MAALKSSSFLALLGLIRDLWVFLLCWHLEAETERSSRFSPERQDCGSGIDIYPQYEVRKPEFTTRDMHHETISGWIRQQTTASVTNMCPSEAGSRNFCSCQLWKGSFSCSLNISSTCTYSIGPMLVVHAVITWTGFHNSEVMLLDRWV